MFVHPRPHIMAPFCKTGLRFWPAWALLREVTTLYDNQAIFWCPRWTRWHIIIICPLLFELPSQVQRTTSCLLQKDQKKKPHKRINFYTMKHRITEKNDKRYEDLHAHVFHWGIPTANQIEPFIPSQGIDQAGFANATGTHNDTGLSFQVMSKGRQSIPGHNTAKDRLITPASEPFFPSENSLHSTSTYINT